MSKGTKSLSKEDIKEHFKIDLEMAIQLILNDYFNSVINETYTVAKSEVRADYWPLKIDTLNFSDYIFTQGQLCHERNAIKFVFAFHSACPIPAINIYNSLELLLQCDSKYTSRSAYSEFNEGTLFYSYNLYQDTQVFPVHISIKIDALAR